MSSKKPEKKAEKKEDNDSVLTGVLGTTKDLSSLIDYQENAVVSKMLLKKKNGNVTLFAFDGQGLSEHSAPFDALVQGLDGDATIMIAGKPNKITKEQVIVMPANKRHAVIVPAGTKFKMLLVMIS